MRMVYQPRRLNNVSTIFRIAIPLVYVAILSFSISDELFWADEPSDFIYAHRISSISDVFKTDGFGYFRPVKNMLWLLFRMLNSFGIEWSHVLAIAIGAISFFPVFFLFRRVFGDEGKALAASSIWILSPTLVSSSAWLSCTNILAMAAFSSLCMIFHDKTWDGDVFRPWSIGAAAIFLFWALISYECAVSVVLLVPLFDFLLRKGRSGTKRARVAYGVYGAVFVVYMILRFLSSAKTSTGGAWTRCDRWQLIVSSPYFTIRHFATWFWPFNQFSVLGSYEWGDASPITLFSCWFLAFSVLAFVILVWRRLPRLAFAILFAVIGFLPTSNCLGFGNGPFGDYYLTLASIGLACGCVELASLLARRQNKCRVPALFCVSVFFVIRGAAVVEAGRWAWFWGRGERAFAASVRYHPEFVSNKTCYIQYLTEEGRYDEALAIGREIEDVYGDDPYRMATVYLSRALHAINAARDSTEALAELDLCDLANNPLVSRNMVEYYRGCVFEDLKDDLVSAEAHYRQALAGDLEFELVPCADRLARLFALRGEIDKAIELWEKAKKVYSCNVSVLWNLSVAYRETGQSKKAEELFSKLRNLTANSDFERIENRKEDR